MLQVKVILMYCVLLADVARLDMLGKPYPIRHNRLASNLPECERGDTQGNYEEIPRAKVQSEVHPYKCAWILRVIAQDAT